MSLVSQYTAARAAWRAASPKARVARRLRADANGVRAPQAWRGRPSVYVPRPATARPGILHRLLNEPDPRRRGEAAGWMVAVLIVVILLAGVRW